ncbi:hypothetical protein L7F22_014626 [Adiantum nelumboides]|nr:hypothetical protein [Adiantum nelumboides]
MLDTTKAEASPSDLELPNSKRLVKMAKKAKDSPLGELSQYADFFPLGLYREFEIPVAKCFLAPEHIICRSMSEDKLEIILGWFTSKANNPASCAYLMPIDWVQEHKAIPKKKDQVKVEDIQNYDYWIIDGQHLISCAKMLVTTNDLDEGLVHLKDVYRYQKARIIVDAPTQVTVAISRIANIEAQALLTKQPYNDILKHLRAQYIHYGKPSRPGVGIAKGHASRVSWDSFISTVETSICAYFAQKQSHMVACLDDIFETWCAIIDDVEKGKLEGKRPNPTYFRCLCGLEFDKVRSIQDMLKKGKILLSKGAGEKSKTYMPEYIMHTKQDKVIQEALALEFSATNPFKKFQDWEEIATFYGMSENIYGMLQKKCDAWVNSKLQVGKSNLEFPLDVRMYIQWIVNISVAEDITKDLPWHIPVDALRSVSSWHKMFFGAIHFMRDAPCRGAIQLFSVLIYLSKGEIFDGYGSFISSKGPILDESLLDIEYQIVRPMDPKAYLQVKKTMLINKCINLYCTQGLMVIDAYSNGIVSRCALIERREVMELAESIKERDELHSKLLSFATLDRQVKEWANIVEDLETAAEDQQQAIESSTSETQLVLEDKTPPSKPFDPRDDESKNMDEDQRQIVKELEGVQDNKAKPCNDLRDYQQNISGHDGEGPRGTTEHQLEPMLLETEVHEGTSNPTQPSSNLQDDESENEDEDQMNIVKGLEGVQVNKPNLYNNDDREYQQKLLINDIEGSHGATEHQLQPILLEAEVHENASTLAWQPSLSLQGTCH